MGWEAEQVNTDDWFVSKAQQLGGVIHRNRCRQLSEPEIYEIVNRRGIQSATIRALEPGEQVALLELSRRLK